MIAVLASAESGGDVKKYERGKDARQYNMRAAGQPIGHKVRRQEGAMSWKGEMTLGLLSMEEA